MKFHKLLASLFVSLALAGTAYADYSFYSAFSLVPGATAQGSVLFQDGTESLPSIAFASQPNTGIYRAGASTLSFSANGFVRALVNNAGFTAVSGQIFGLAQVAASPTYSFSGDTDTGMYQAGANQIGLATGGVARWYINSAGDFIQDGATGRDIVFALTNSLVRQNTTDGADNKSLAIVGGGAEGQSRGSSILTYGNEFGSSVGGAIILRGGAVTNESQIYFQNMGLTRFTINTSGEIIQDATNGGNIVLTRAGTAVRQGAITGISAAGSVQADATLLTQVYTWVTTVGAGQGVRLWDAPIGSVIFVHNVSGANDLRVYPPVGHTINTGAANAPITLTTAAKQQVFLTKLTANAWSALVGSGV
jgi:hypothetical protein